MVDPASVDRYLCLAVDVVGYGRNDDPRQARIQQELLASLEAAAEAAGLDRTCWLRQAKGDEELCLVPAKEMLPRVAGAFSQQLDIMLRNLNASRDHRDRIRLRLAIDDGPVQPAANGYSGQAVVGVSRLVNSAVVKRALELADDAVLAVIVSQVVFRDWIGSRLSDVEPEWFRAVQVTEKEFDEKAWLWLPGTDTHRLSLVVPEGAPDRAGATTAGAPQSVTTKVMGELTINGGSNVFGIRNG
ncbi:hypothetical protein Rhe02_03260 [Rhizocola hellebori]|uniref:Guanylate cyclase domain-containing protein n=1 Tax=Rhizocola hellebori TaxID=1392758 RepID=A0A8J3VC64_9ACTN|nr:hypothetical protein [Rhizocola hellebori]GIH02259.1 hypothetical protein Rhe02_03260 [Rhizocola hellebori]